MNIKSKIRVGLGLIFIIVLFFGGISIYFISQLSNSAKVILKNNYETLSFTRGMREVLDVNKLPLNDAAKAAFNTQLVKQERNITEKGEYQVTADVRRAFAILQSATATPEQQESAVNDARNALRKIEGLNMAAIVKKTDAAQSSVNNAVIVLGIICCFTFLALFSFSVNISGFVADPLIKLKEALVEISDKNYDYCLELNKNKEFEDLSEAFNHMTALLKRRDSQDLTAVFAEKNRIEAIIEHTTDAVIVTNENHEVIFINRAAKDLFNLHKQQVVGRTVNQLAAAHRMIRSVLQNEGGEGSFKFEVDGKETTFRMESVEIYVPNIAPIRTDEINIARLPAGKVYLLKNIGEFHEA
jgi:PAS domain S-box-containing protein